MEHLFDLIFKQPVVDIPVGARLIPGFAKAIEMALKLTYQRGIYDGFVAGVLLTLLVVPSLRRKG